LTDYATEYWVDEDNRQQCMKPFPQRGPAHHLEEWHNRLKLHVNHAPPQEKNHKLIQEPDRSRHQQKVLNDPTQGVMSMECRNIVNRLPTRLGQSKSTPDAPSPPLPTLINSAVVCNWLQTFYIQCITIVIYYLNVFIALINKVYIRFL
jgi:hypothetical protein